MKALALVSQKQV